jgi:hypothetical protein
MQPEEPRNVARAAIKRTRNTYMRPLPRFCSILFRFYTHGLPTFASRNLELSRGVAQ